jgi:hypothetical protein
MRCAFFWPSGSLRTLGGGGGRAGGRVWGQGAGRGASAARRIREGGGRRRPAAGPPPGGPGRRARPLPPPQLPLGAASAPAAPSRRGPRPSPTGTAPPPHLGVRQHADHAAVLLELLQLRLHRLLAVGVLLHVAREGALLGLVPGVSGGGGCLGGRWGGRAQVSRRGGGGEEGEGSGRARPQQRRKHPTLPPPQPPKPQPPSPRTSSCRSGACTRR